jgi:hypothetical protein
LSVPDIFKQIGVEQHNARSESQRLPVRRRKPLDFAVAAQRVDDGIESVPNNSIAAFDSGVREHRPQDICNFSRHTMLASTQ